MGQLLPPPLFKLFAAFVLVILALSAMSKVAEFFCIYDQTVAPLNVDQVPAPTHAGIFARFLPPTTLWR